VAIAMKTNDIQDAILKAMKEYDSEITEKYGKDIVRSLDISGIHARVSKTAISQGQIIYGMRQLVKDKKVERLGGKTPKYSLVK